MSIVSAEGEHRTINAYSDPDYFYAVRGGGGNAWGVGDRYTNSIIFCPDLDFAHISTKVVTSVTYKTHPNPQNFAIGLVRLNARDNSTFRTIVEKSLKLLPSITEAGYTGYGSISGGFAAIFVRPNGTDELFNSTFSPFYELAALPGVNGSVTGFGNLTWIDYANTFLQDPNIAMNVQDASRLLTADVLEHKASEPVDLIIENGGEAGFNFSMYHNSACIRNYFLRRIVFA